MDDRVIEAAAKAMLAADDAYDPDGSEPGLYTSMAIAGIKAADAARAEAVKAAAEALFHQAMTYADALWFVEEFGSRDYDPDEELIRVEQEKAKLLALLNIED